jgi:phthalate 4,5-dioxygenase oxygenase subunit
MYSYVGNSGWPKAGRAWVPIDDHHTVTFGYSYNAQQPFSQNDINLIESGQAFPPRLEYGKFTLPDGYVVDISLPVAHRENDYLIDRQLQKTVNFTGLWGLNEQDRSVQENMLSSDSLPVAVIVDRTKEHLGTADLPTIAARRRLIRMARELQHGIEPNPATHGDLYRVRSPALRESDISDFEELFKVHLEEEAKALA